MARSQVRTLMSVLRLLLRARGIRQCDVAQKLGVTDRTVTRWFSTESVDTRVVEQLCDLVGMTFFELCDLAARRVEHRISRLTPQQEQALADNPLLTYLFEHTLRGWSAEELRREIGIPEPIFIDAAIQLEKIGLIELLPGNEIRLRTVKDIEWQPSGPFSKYINKWLAWVLDRADIAEPNTSWNWDALKLSAASRAQVDAKFVKLRQEMQELSDLDRRSHAQACNWYALVQCVRPLDMRPLSEWTAAPSFPHKGRTERAAPPADEPRVAAHNYSR
jgi:transcriptional regulator with XRE-family HTH domain